MKARRLHFLLILLRVFLFCLAGGIFTGIAAWLDVPQALAPWIFVSNGLGAVAAVDVFLWLAYRRGWLKRF